MKITQLIEGNEYARIHTNGQPTQKVKVLKVEEKNDFRCGKYFIAELIYTSDDNSKGLITKMNEIECERYLYPLR